MELSVSEDISIRTGPSAGDAAVARRCRLDQIARGEVARITGLDADASPRLATLGFCPGTRVSLDRRAPLGDPLIFELRGTRLALRGHDAHAIRVEVIAS